MSVKAQNVTGHTEDGLPILKPKQASSAATTEDGLPILKKKEETGSPLKASSLGIGATPTQIPTSQPTPSVSGGKGSIGIKDWSALENSLKDVRDKSDESKFDENLPIPVPYSAGGMGMSVDQNTRQRLKKESKANLDKSIKQRDQLFKEHEEELTQPIKQLIDNGQWKNYVDNLGNFKSGEARKYINDIVKSHNGGNYLTDQLLTQFKQAALYEYDQPQREKLRNEEYKKAGIDVSKYGPDLFNKMVAPQYNELESLSAETKEKGAELLNTYKPKMVEVGKNYTDKLNAIIGQYKNNQLSEQDANVQLQELKQDYTSKIKELDQQYQRGVRQINLKTTQKYARINEAIQKAKSSITDEMVFQSIPKSDRDKINKINNEVERKIDQQRQILRKGLDITADAGMAPLEGLFVKSVKSGWYGGLSSLGNYLSMQGYDGTFTRYLQSKQYEADVNAPGEYTFGDNFLKRSVTSSGTSLGASAPILLPATAITLGTSGLGLPEIVSTIATGLTSYYGEKAQNTGQVYQELLDKTGDVSKALIGAKDYENKQAIMMPLYFLEGAGIQNLLKGKGLGKALLGTAEELTQELPTEYWQNYTEAQQVEGYKGSFGAYIKEHPDTALDVITSTIGQSGIMNIGGKVFNQFNSILKNPKAQFYADIINKHGIEFAVANLQQQYNSGIIDETQFKNEHDKLMQAASKLKEFEGLGLKGEDAKAYFTLTENANRLKESISKTQDEGLRIGYESQLKETQGELDALVKGKGAYAIFTLPGGGDQTKIAPLSHLQQLEKEGKLGQLIHLSDGVKVVGDEELNKQFQERKALLGVPEDAPEGFYTYGKKEGVGPEVKPEQKVDIAKESESIISKSIDDGKLKGMWADQAKQNPAAFMKMVADQAFGRTETGEMSKEPNAEYAAKQQFGDELVEKAKELFPLETKPTIESIQKQAEQSRESVMPILKRINDADYINENELNTAADHLYNILDQIEKSDMTDEQKQSQANIIEPLIQKIEGYEFRTKTETRSVTEAKTASIPRKTAKPEIKPALEKSAGSKATITSPDGSKVTGTLNIKSGQYVLDVPQGQQRVIGEKAITDRDLTLPSEQEMDNPIKFDKNGNVESITLKDRNGNLIEIHDPEKALDMAIQLRADAIGEVPEQLFNTAYEETTKEIKQEKLVNDGRPQINTPEDFEKALKDIFAADKGKALPKLGEINKENNKRDINEDKSQYTPESVLQKAKEFYKTDPLIQRVIKFLEPIIKGNPNVKIDHSFDWSKGEYEGQKITDQALGYSFPSGKLILNFDRMGDYDTLYRTALHEMVHAATRNEISTNKAFGEDLKNVLGDVRKAMKLPEGDSFVDSLVRNGIISKDYEGLYGATNEHELLAEVFTNDKFSNFLKGLEYKGDNMLHRLYLSIAKFFSENYKQLVGAKESINASNIADYLMGLTESIVKGTEGITGKDGEALAQIRPEQEGPLKDIVSQAIQKGIPEQFIKDKLKEIGNLSDDEIDNVLKSQTDAQKIRKDQGIPSEAGETSTGGETNSGGDIQQTAQTGTTPSDTKEQVISPKTKTDETKTEKTKAQETKGVREGQDVTTSSPTGKEGVPGSEPGTPSPPTTEPRKVAQTPKGEWTAITKEKLSEVKAVKDMFEQNAETKKWAGEIEGALTDLQAMYPDKSLYDAAKQRVAHFAALFDNNIPFNPTTRDLSVMQYLKAETEKGINDIDGWDSFNEAERIGAVEQFQRYNQDLVSIAKAINPSEAGRAFGYRQSMMQLNPEYGLQVRRMQLLDAKNGEKLTDAEKTWSSEMWEKEKDLMRREQELREQSMKEGFDKQMNDLKKQYEEKLKQAKKGTSKESVQQQKRNDFLKQKGKDIADRIRKGKDLGGGLKSTIPGLQQAWSALVEGVAKLVEAGYTVADAIDKHIKDNKIKDEDAKKLTNQFYQFIDQQVKQSDSFDKIKELAKGTGATTITSDMVSSNAIKDFVESHIGEVTPENMLEHVTSKLEGILPNVTKDKLINAYSKQGEFYVPTQKELKSEYEKDKSQLNRLVNIEKQLSDLKNKGDVYKKQGNLSKAQETDKAIEAKEKELRKELNNFGTKLSGEDKYSKAANETRAQAHNDRIDGLVNSIQDFIGKGNLSPEQVSSLNKLKTQLEGSKIKLDENSKLSQTVTMDHAENLIKGIKSEFDKNTPLKDLGKFNDIRKGLRQAIEKFNSDKQDTEQTVKLQRTKDNLQRSNDEKIRKLNAGEYNDETTSIPLKLSDAELVKLQVQKNQIDSKWREKQKELVDQNKSNAERAAETARGIFVASLIGAFGTNVKVAVSALTKPLLNVTTKAIGGQIYKGISPSIYKVAKKGGESSSYRVRKAALRATFNSIGEKKFVALKDKLYDKFDADKSAYDAQKITVDNIQDKDSKEYKTAKKQLDKLKSNLDSSTLRAMGAFAYDFIGSSNIKDSLEALLHRANYIERQFGYTDIESWKGNNLDKLNYAIGFVGRTHAALKTFSARSEFVAGFLSRLEYYQGEGIDITNPDKILEVAYESYLDWDRGKYQQSNFISDIFNSVTNAIDKKNKGTEWEKYSKALSMGLKWDMPITRVPVNMLHEAIAEYTMGLPFAIYDTLKEYYKARKVVINEQSIMPNQKEFREAIKQQISKLDEKQAAAIVRGFRKGGFSMGLFALNAVLGIMAFGGFYRKGRKKKEDEDALNPGEIMIGDKKMGELFSKTIEHIPALAPILYGQNFAKVRSENIEKGGSDLEGDMYATLATLETIIDNVPQSQLVGNPLEVAKRVAKPELKRAEAVSGFITDFIEGSDVDENGNVIVRKPLSWKDHIKLLQGDRKGVLTEQNYKEALSVKRSYNKSIEDMRKAGSSQDEIEKVEQDRDDAIQKIYELNENQ